MRALAGHELSGVITTIGKDVQDFEIGDGTAVRCKGHRRKVAALDDAVAAFNPTERIKEKMVIRVHP